MLSRLLIVLLAVAVARGWTDLKAKDSPGLGLEPGPLVRATKGQVWPKPQIQSFFDDILTIDPKTFTFPIVGQTCKILTDAISRYSTSLQQLKKMMRRVRKKIVSVNKATWSGVLLELKVNLTLPCEYHPYMLMNERYSLRVGRPEPATAELISTSIWGILRGLETFSQLLYAPDDSAQLIVNATEVVDFPRFVHRGLHLDTARHYMPMRIIKTVLDGMAVNKMNVFHWHIVDDQSFPYVSKKWPQLSAKGAYSPAHTYTSENIAEIIEYSRVRGIRVVPEFDTPGHTRSWGEAFPELLTPCYDQNGDLDGSLGPLNPISNFTYTFMSEFIQELVEVFPDSFLHLGGDEVPFDCWLSNPDIWQYIMNKGITPEALEGEYIKQIIDRTVSLNSTPIVWQEVFDNGVYLPSNAVVHVWKDWIDYKAEMANVTKSGYRALFSSCWYLDHLNTGGDWQKFYECDPLNFNGDDAAYAKVIGGEACMWAEVADATNVMTRVWPRACAVAEKLWSAANIENMDSVAKRLEEHACRMNSRGIPAQPPNGPSFCPFQLFT